MMLQSTIKELRDEVAAAKEAARKAEEEATHATRQMKVASLAIVLFMSGSS